jgi:Uma2 family endonuclease
MARPIRPANEALPLPTVPTVDAWRAMTPAARERFVIEVNAALTGPADVMGEGQPHRNAKSRILDALGLHFRAIGRVVYLADDLGVHYPGEEPFAPDILAVLDVPQPEEDERMAWVVADEGKGPDLVIEVLYKGDRDKDLVENVERYARLGISEYFVYDRLRQQIHGFRLNAGASRYQRILPQLGHHASRVLCLDLAIIGNNLRFLSGEATLPFSADLISRLQGMVEGLESRAHEAQAAAEQAQATAAEARAAREAAEARTDEVCARAEAAEAEVARLLLEIERLKEKG